MLNDVQLFINDKKIDFKEPFHINFSYKVEDVTEPTAIKNSYSKTVKVEGTPHNNQVFSNLWNVNTVAGSGMAYEYDLTRKNQFKLYFNGELIESGYVKLDKINNRGNVKEYDITLYGGLGDFFYNLSMDQDGKKKKLCDLDFGGGEKEFDTIVNASNVKYAWDRLYYDYSYNKTQKFDKINFAPCYNGVPADWDTKKYMVDVDNNPFLFAGRPSGPSAKGGVFLAEVPGDREYTEWDAGDLRSYMQRPVLRFRALMEAIQNPKNNGGYQVELDPAFFNKNNPYYEKAWITLPLLRDTDPDLTGSDGTATAPALTILYSPENTIKVSVSNPSLDMNKGTLTVPYRLNAVYTGFPWRKLLTSYKNVILADKTDYYVSAYCVQLVAKDSTGTPVYASETQVITSGLFTFTPEQMGYNPDIRTSNRIIKGDFVWDGKGSDYPFEKNDSLSISLKNMALEAGMTFELVVTKLTKHNLTGTVDFNTMFRAKDPFETINNPLVQLRVNAGMNFKPLTGTFKQVAPTKTLLTKKRILSTKNTPLEYLLGYAKQLGLYFVRDQVEKKITVMTRNTFFNGGEVIDLTGKIDRGKDMSITPLAFDKKWYDFALKIGKSKYAEQYNKSNDVDFGVQRVDTNYDYDRGHKNLLDKVIYNNAVMLREKSNYKVNLLADYLTTEDPLPPAMIDGANFSYFEPNKEVTAWTDVNIKPTKNNYLTPIYSGMKFYDRAPLMCFYNEEKRPIDGSNVLCFFNGTVPTADAAGGKVWLRLSDDTDEMNELNDNKPCWIYSTRKTNGLSYIPVFGRYYTGGTLSVQSSFNMGNPIETYTFDYAFNEDCSVYAKRWQSFIRDQYSKDTRIMECYVLLENRVMQDYLRNIFFFDGAYWALLEVNNYDLCDTVPVKCKFIKIQDLSNYTDGQFN